MKKPAGPSPSPPSARKHPDEQRRYENAQIRVQARKDLRRKMKPKSQ